MEKGEINFLWNRWFQYLSFLSDRGLFSLPQSLRSSYFSICVDSTEYLNLNSFQQASYDFDSYFSDLDFTRWGYFWLSVPLRWLNPSKKIELLKRILWRLHFIGISWFLCIDPVNVWKRRYVRETDGKWQHSQLIEKSLFFFHAQYLRRTRTKLEHQRIYNLNFFFPSLTRKFLHFQHQLHVIHTLIRSLLPPTLIYSSFISAIPKALVLLIITLRWHKSEGKVYTMDGDKVSSLHTCRKSEKSQDILNPDMIFYV